MPTPVLTGGTLPRVSVPLGTRVWKFGMDKVYLPFYRRFMGASVCMDCKVTVYVYVYVYVYLYGVCA